jgi:hypothetical protein
VAYNALISRAFAKSRWLEVKRVYKLCNNLTAPKKGMAGYDPTYKYNFIYKVLVHNVMLLPNPVAWTCVVTRPAGVTKALVKQVLVLLDRSLASQVSLAGCTESWSIQD